MDIIMVSVEGTGDSSLHSSIRGKRKSLLVILVLSLCLMGVAAYFYSEVKSGGAIPITILRIGVIPDEEEIVVRKRYDPLLRYLSSTTGLDVELVLPTSYAELIGLFSEQKIDLAYFGGLTFVQAYMGNKADPLVMRDIDMRFTSNFFVRGQSDVQDFYALKGARFSFGNELSTSGHLMPRAFLQSELNIKPEHFFSEVIYSGTHDRTAYLVRSGKVDVGVANSLTIKQMIKDGRLEKNDLKIIWQTPPYSNYVWSVQKSMDAQLKLLIRDSFLGLRNDDVQHQRILSDMRAASFFPADIADFRFLIEAASEFDMIGVKVDVTGQ